MSIDTNNDNVDNDDSDDNDDNSDENDDISDDNSDDNSDVIAMIMILQWCITTSSNQNDTTYNDTGK